jgi:hypothetical protein
MRNIVFLLGVVMALAAAPLHAADAEPPTYAFLSLIGDVLDVSIFEAQIGSKIDKNRHVLLEITGPGFDNAAIAAASEVLQRMVPNAVLTKLETRSPALFKNQRAMFDGASPSVAIPAPIVAALKNQGATRLILITKFRDDADLQMADSHVGKGKLEGLGFYLDQAMGVRNVESNMESQGILAPYMYARISLIDVQTLRILKEQFIKSSSIYTAQQSKDSTNAWDALTTDQKLRIIERLIRKEIPRIMPDLLEPVRE